MKKVYALVLAVGLVFVLLAGCGTAASSSAAEGTAPEASSVAESVVSELTDGGSADIEYVGMIFPQINHQWFITVSDEITAVLEDAGVRVELESSENDQARQLQLVENFAEKGVDGLILFPAGYSEIGGTLEKMQADGVRIVTFINAVDKGYDAMILENPAESGAECARIAAEWIDATFPDAEPGSIEVGVLSIRENPVSEGLSDGMLSIEQLTDKAKVVVEYTATFGDADTKSQANTELMLVEYPDVKVILSYNHPLSVDEVVMRTPGVDFAEFGLFSNTFDDAVIERIGASRNDESVIRGLAISGDGTYGHVAKAMLGQLELNEDNIYYEPVGRITPENVDNYL